jgi:hypothetical protein
MKTIQKILSTLLVILKFIARITLKVLAFVLQKIAEGLAFLASKLETPVSTTTSATPDAKTNS